MPAAAETPGTRDDVSSRLGLLLAAPLPETKPIRKR
jgi:hypothetical protein